MAGIGKGLTMAYLAIPNYTVIATGDSSRPILLQLSLDSPSTIAQAISQAQEQHLVNQIDIVIANAGICNHCGSVVDMEDRDMTFHFEVNTLGPLRLFRAVIPLLEASKQPKFVYISSELASTTGLDNSSSMTTAYGVSKVASNYMIKKIHTEHEALISFSIDPGSVYTSSKFPVVMIGFLVILHLIRGNPSDKSCLFRFVQTNMGNRSGRLGGLAKAPMSIDESVEGTIE
ncbi:uncharacterized protein KD926_000746 [Aspergillus affinis]|uniref:uncharacterized protein n=1 Tax=Aspergillus affinis TaxID=1070780 RepID=UPI0022FE6DAD|nr:uncharacterized protein KD926_000746 [Aspergillus affinis]KAI9037173.1 hypothetical protein KD926_000746 [Aspergillus affinis]